MRSKIVFLAVLFSTVFVQSASAAIITYKFTASFRSAQEFGGEIIAPNSYFDQARQLSEISGILRYDDAAAIAFVDTTGVFYNGFSEVLLDQFSTMDPDRINTDMAAVKFPGQEVFSVGSTISSNDPIGIYNSIGFSFESNTNDLLTGFEIPSTITLSNLSFATIRVTTDQIGGPSASLPEKSSIALFDITSLERIEEVPIPGAMVIFLAGFGALAARSKSLFLRKQRNYEGRT